MFDRRARRIAVLLAGLTWSFAFSVVPSPGALAGGTPTAQLTGTPSISSDSTATAMPTTTPAPTPSVTARPGPPITREPTSAVKRSRRPSRLRTATPVPRHHHRAHRHEQHRRHHRGKPHPTPTSTPVMDLNAEDSISPVTCNGAGKRVARKPFLTAPYRGWTSIVSYFDHDLPDFAQDGLVVTATGARAMPDATHRGSGFPAYWNRGMRQYIYYDGHNGYDYNLWYEPVYAAAPGKVIFARYEYPDATDHGYGKMVMIDHRNGYVTLYGHFSRIMVKVGQKVRRGQQIGVSGNTGHSTGPHLHFTVFHNCSPSDPYGWIGSGSDPLASYQNESSVYLWRQPPLVLNPAPGWPGMGALPLPSSERIVLLRLPGVRAGAASFTRELERRAARLRGQLRRYHAGVKVDLLRGALDIAGPVPPAEIYRLPEVASITTPGVIEGAKSDVLAALARAALVRPPRAVVVRSTHWTGYLLHWQGRALLLGRGARGRRVDFRLATGRGGDAQHTIRTDPETGDYVLDLGHMTPAGFSQLLHVLRGDGKHRSGVGVRVDTRTSALPQRGGSVPWFPLAAGLLALLLALSLVIGWRIRPQRT